MNIQNSLLQERGLRNTPLRRAILEIFSQKRIPLTIPELTEFLAQRSLQPNKTSLYRQVETLLQKNILEEVPLTTGIKHYELSDHHHHHFVCESCADITCISDERLEKDIHSLMKKLAEKGLAITNHQFSLSGLCAQCS